MQIRELLQVLLPIFPHPCLALENLACVNDLITPFIIMEAPFSCRLSSRSSCGRAERVRQSQPLQRLWLILRHFLSGRDDELSTAQLADISGAKVTFRAGRLSLTFAAPPLCISHTTVLP